jgi:hypothetical protein
MIQRPFEITKTVIKKEKGVISNARVTTAKMANQSTNTRASYAGALAGDIRHTDGDNDEKAILDGR